MLLDVMSWYAHQSSVYIVKYIYFIFYITSFRVKDLFLY